MGLGGWPPALPTATARAGLTHRPPLRRASLVSAARSDVRGGRAVRRVAVQSGPEVQTSPGERCHSRLKKGGFCADTTVQGAAGGRVRKDRDIKLGAPS